jgi:hypothetical protein
MLGINPGSTWAIARRTCLTVPILAIVEVVQGGELTKFGTAKNLHLIALSVEELREVRVPYWHVFIKSLIGIPSARGKILNGRAREARVQLGVIILDFVIIPGHYPWTLSMHGL